MKIKAITLLFFFVSFLTLPTILSRVCNDIDISMAYTMAEEEETHNSISEVLNDFATDKNEIALFSLRLRQDKIIEEYFLKHDNISSEILSPPPEQKLV
ncbi:MAG: hypothetical protein AB7D46_07370 [Flavobacteriaceae bacterium]